MITIHLTDETISTAVMKEYNKTHGIYCAPMYTVPTYLMMVDTRLGPMRFEVIRAGPSRSLAHYPKFSRIMRYGIFKKHAMRRAAGWVDYSPRTIGATIRGAVRLWPGKGYLIHEGPPNHHTVMGTAGCVEIIGEQAWKNFVALVEYDARKGDVQFHVDPIKRPTGKLVVTERYLYRRLAHAIYRNWKNSGRTEYELRSKDVDRLIAGAEKRKGVSHAEAKQLAYIWWNYHMPDKAVEKLGQFLATWSPGDAKTKPSHRLRRGR